MKCIRTLYCQKWIERKVWKRVPYTVGDNGGAGGLELIERRRHDGRMELWMVLRLICVCFGVYERAIGKIARIVLIEEISSVELTSAGVNGKGAASRYLLRDSGLLWRGHFRFACNFAVTSTPLQLPLLLARLAATAGTMTFVRDLPPHYPSSILLPTFPTTGAIFAVLSYLRCFYFCLS